MPHTHQCETERERETLADRTICDPLPPPPPTTSRRTPGPAPYRTPRSYNTPRRPHASRTLPCPPDSLLSGLEPFLFSFMTERSLCCGWVCVCLGGSAPLSAEAWRVLLMLLLPQDVASIAASSCCCCSC